MTTNELFELITSEPKWYASKIDRHHASLIKKKHRECRYTNYEWLFKLFGYSKTPDNWEKNETK